MICPLLSEVPPGAPGRFFLGFSELGEGEKRVQRGRGSVLLNSTVSVDAGLTAWFGRNAGGSGFYDQVALVNVAFSGGAATGYADAAAIWDLSALETAFGL